MNNSATGIAGELLPDIMRGNDWLTGTLLLCFLMTAYVLAVGRHTLMQRVRDFFLTRERSSIFTTETAGDVHCRLLLLLQTCLLGALLITCLHPGRPSIPHALCTCSLHLLAYGLCKWCIYRAVNWIFFNKTKSRLWTDSYFFIHALLGLFLFPPALLVVYSQLPPFAAVISCLVLFVLAHLLLLYKCFSIFFNKSYGVFYLFVYFCTLEAAPLLILCRGLGLID